MEQNNDFEILLKTNSDGYRMYPSPKVWNNINYNLHGKQRLTIATILCLFITMFLLSIVPSNTVTNKEDKLNFTGVLLNDNESKAFEIQRNDVYTTNLIAKKTEPVLILTTGNKLLTGVSIFTKSKLKSPVYTLSNNRLDNSTTIKTIKPNEVVPPFNIIEMAGTVTNESNSIVAKTENNEVSTRTTNKEMENASLIESMPSKPIINVIKKDANPNLLNDPIYNIVKTKSKVAKVRAQYYVAPSISYRLLKDERGNYINIPNANTTNLDLDKAVFHKPAMGMEAGVNWLIKLNRTFIFKTGLQFNYNRYNIKTANSQPEIATIALSNGNQNLNSVTTLRNVEGATYPNWVENSNLQVSIPIGLNVVVAGSSKVQFGLGTSIQPSYLLKNKILLLSTDLKNYTKAPSLINRFNFNTALETFIAVNGKKIRWQFGPQLRYQMLSTYNKKYPIKENLFDYGFKFGISKPL